LRRLPTPHNEILSQAKAHLNLSHTPLTYPWALDRRLELIFEWALWVQSKSTLTSSSTTSFAFISLVDSFARAQELLSVWLDSRKFVLSSLRGLIVKSRTWFKWWFREDLGLRATRSFVDSSPETYVPLWCWTSGINHCLLCLVVIYFRSSCYYIAYLGFRKLLNEITY
jgi:hypothetical protein